MKVLICFFSVLFQADPEELALDAGVLAELRAAEGRTIAVDRTTRLGQYLRCFAFVRKGETSLPITREVLAQARGIAEHFAAPRYFPGKRVLLADENTGEATIEAEIREVLPGGQMKVKLARGAMQVVNGSEIRVWNDPTRPDWGKQGDITFDARDKLLQSWRERADGIVDQLFPKNFGDPERLLAEQEVLLQKQQHAFLAPEEHPGRVVRIRASTDPESEEVGIRSELATVFWGIVHEAARRAGIDTQLVVVRDDRGDEARIVRVELKGKEQGIILEPGLARDGHSIWYDDYGSLDGLQGRWSPLMVEGETRSKATVD